MHLSGQIGKVYLNQQFQKFSGPLPQKAVAKEYLIWNTKVLRGGFPLRGSQYSNDSLVKRKMEYWNAGISLTD